MSQKSFTIFTWSLFGLSILLPFIAWGSRLNWELGDINGYQLFPLLGLLAWMIMWGHYVTGAFRVNDNSLTKPAGYGAVSGWIVLACILLHPGILAIEQSRNGAGLPLQSFFDYVGQNFTLAILIASISLIIFLSYEVFDRIKNRPGIKKWWWAISISQILAMILIYVHALRLGTDVMSGWFMAVWILYGLVLIPNFYIVLRGDFAAKLKENE
jgi:hypothetical protein